MGAAAPPADRPCPAGLAGHCRAGRAWDGLCRAALRGVLHGLSDSARLGAGRLACAEAARADRAVRGGVRLRLSGRAALRQRAAGRRLAAAAAAARAGTALAYPAAPQRHAGRPARGAQARRSAGQQHRAVLGAALSFVRGAVRGDQPLPHRRRGGTPRSGHAVERGQRRRAEPALPGGGHPLFWRAALLPLSDRTAFRRAGACQRGRAV